MLSDLSYQQLRFAGRPRRSMDPPRTATGPDHRLHQERESPPLAADEARLVQSVLASVGVDAAAYRAAPLRRRIPAVLRAMRAATPDRATDTLTGNDGSLADRALNSLLIGHTEAFRDAEPFDELRQRVLPELTSGGVGLRVWSVGCSRGMELLSVALLLAERGVLAGSRLRGSDCRPAAIEAARSQGVACLASDVDARLPELAGELRSAEFADAAARIEWCVEDALAEGEGGPWDLILCRNLAIYLEAAAARRLWQRLVAALARRGVLVTGKAERPAAHLPLTRLAKCIYQRDGRAG